jgi:drug/metabolite transporter (DMT)-like permease
VVLALRLRQVAWLWILLGLTGLVLMVAHPADGEWDRMMLPLWMPISCALGYGGYLTLRKARADA